MSPYAANIILPTILLVVGKSVRLVSLHKLLEENYNVISSDNDILQVHHLLENNGISLIVYESTSIDNDCIDFCQTLKSDNDFSFIPVIVITRSELEQDHIRILNSYADSFAVWPFNSTYLLSLINNVLTNRELLYSSFLRSPFVHKIYATGDLQDKRFVDKMSAFIDSHISDPELSVQMLAEYMNMSISTFFRRVRECYKISPRSVIREYRLYAAMELLKSENHNITEIAERVGFSNVTYFTNCFIKQFGIKPKDIPFTSSQLDQ